MKGRIYFVCIGFIIFVASCNSGNKEILRKDDFVNLLVDFHYYDAMITDHAVASQFKEIDSASVYSAVLDKYNTDQETFYKTLDWYSHHPKEFAEVYDEVFGILNKRKEALNELSESFSDRDLNNIFNEGRYKKYEGDSISYPAPFYIELTGLNDYYFDIRLRMLKEDASRNPYILISLLKDKNDTIGQKDIIKAPIVKSNFTRNFQFVYTLDDSTYKYARIEIPNTIDRDAFKHKDLQISKLRVMTQPEEKDDDTDDKK